MNKHYDVIVVGLGIMGSACVYHLAKNGCKVLGIEQFMMCHDKGSSHGKTRVIRQAYFEGDKYVPLVMRAYELWRDLEKQSRQSLLQITGGLMIGHRQSRILQGSIASADYHQLKHQILNAATLRKRYPQFSFADSEQALYEEHTGILNPEASVAAFCQLALVHRAKCQFLEAVRSVKSSSQKVIVETNKGQYTANKIVVCCGPWTGMLFPMLKSMLNPQRVVMHWFKPKDEKSFSTNHFPVFVRGHEDGLECYGIPGIDTEQGVKIAFHSERSPCFPANLSREVFQHERETIIRYVDKYLPQLDGQLVASKVCMYTTTRDEGFILDQHPEDSRVYLAGGFSGHGFKFAPVVGEIMTNLCQEKPLEYNIDAFRIKRFFH